MSEEEFISVLACIGILGGVHIFSWLTVFQFRKNLLEEQRLLERTVATAPLPNLGKQTADFIRLARHATADIKGCKLKLA